MLYNARNLFFTCQYRKTFSNLSLLLGAWIHSNNLHLFVIFIYFCIIQNSFCLIKMETLCIDCCPSCTSVVHVIGWFVCALFGLCVLCIAACASECLLPPPRCSAGPSVALSPAPRSQPTAAVPYSSSPWVLKSPIPTTERVIPLARTFMLSPS